MNIMGKDMKPGAKKKESIAEKVGFSSSLDFVIDEFDHSFNDLAIASMTFHLHHSPAGCSEEMAKKYTDLIERLSEDKSGFPYTGEDIKHKSTCVKGISNRTNARYRAQDFGLEGDAKMRFLEDSKKAVCEECQELRSRKHLYERQLKEDMTQARKDFVDIVPSLWS